MTESITNATGSDDESLLGLGYVDSAGVFDIFTAIISSILMGLAILHWFWGKHYLRCIISRKNSCCRRRAPSKVEAAKDDPIEAKSGVAAVIGWVEYDLILNKKLPPWIAKIGALGCVYSVIHLMQIELQEYAICVAMLGLLSKLVHIFIFYCCFRATTALVDAVTGALAKSAASSKDRIDDLLAPLVGEVLRLFVTAVWVIVTLQALGMDMLTATATVSVFALVAGLAAQEYVQNFVGLCGIIYEKPFTVGDWVSIGSTTGTCMGFTLRYCTLVGVDGCARLVPNSSFLKEVVTNTSTQPRIYKKLTWTIADNIDSMAANTAAIGRMRSDLLAQLRRTAEFSGGANASVRLGFEEGQTKVTVEVHFLQHVLTKDSNLASLAAPSVKPSWPLFVEAEAKLVLAVRAAMAAHGLNFQTIMTNVASQAQYSLAASGKTAEVEDI